MQRGCLFYSSMHWILFKYYIQICIVFKYASALHEVFLICLQKFASVHWSLILDCRCSYIFGNRDQNRNKKQTKNIDWGPNYMVQQMWFCYGDSQPFYRYGYLMRIAENMCMQRFQGHEALPFWGKYPSGVDLALENDMGGGTGTPLPMPCPHPNLFRSPPALLDGDLFGNSQLQYSQSADIVTSSLALSPVILVQLSSRRKFVYLFI